MITRIAFLSPQPLVRRVVDVPGLGRVFVRAMTAGERDEFEVSHARAKQDFRARLIAFTACDQEGGAPVHGRRHPRPVGPPRAPAPGARGRRDRGQQADRGRRAGPRGRGKKLIERPERRFLFKLALALGKTVGELEQLLSDRELEEWLTYHSRIQPLPDPYWIGAQAVRRHRLDVGQEGRPHRDLPAAPDRRRPDEPGGVGGLPEASVQ